MPSTVAGTTAATVRVGAYPCRVKFPRWTGRVVGLAIGLYFIGRAIAEPFIIDFSDPASYRDD